MKDFDIQLVFKMFSRSEFTHEYEYSAADLNVEPTNITDEKGEAESFVFRREDKPRIAVLTTSLRTSLSQDAMPFHVREGQGVDTLARITKDAVTEVAHRFDNVSGCFSFTWFGMFIASLSGAR